MITRMLFASVFLLGSLTSFAAAQTVQLITDKEATLPPAPQVTTRGITRGPGVKLLTPESVANRT
ncbi:MAG: hypothetical protein ABIP88_17110, partial [Candidatus Binatia bacterium]